MRKKTKTDLGFTLMEILIVVALIVLLLTAFLILFNPAKQIQKSWDAKRKHELSQLQKVLEDWYNDKNCYPKPSEICYDPSGVERFCHICGNESRSPNFSPYLSKLPCDPQHPKKKYLYEVEGYEVNCPLGYKIHAYLEENKGQGEIFNYAGKFYNYQVLAGRFLTISPTPFPTPFLSPTPCPDDPTPKYCVSAIDGYCNNCGNFNNCSNICNPDYGLFSDFSCHQPCYQP